MRILCVNTGLANIASVRRAFMRLNVNLSDVVRATDIASADALVMPGVGAFGPAMQSLRSRDLVAPLRDAIISGRPLFAICLGLQLLCDGSDESSGVEGLSILPSRVQRLEAHAAERIRVPHMGWNRITPCDDARLLTAGSVYFAHSFAVKHAPAGWAYATVSHGSEFVAALEHRGVVACQFHPELSGLVGSELIRRWLAMVQAGLRKGGGSCSLAG